MIVRILLSSDGNKANREWGICEMEIKADLTEELAIVRALIAKNGNPPLDRETLEAAAEEGATAPALVSVPTFLAGDGRIIQFFPLTDRVLRQSSTHRVVVDGLAVDWLGRGFWPSRKSAQFFLDKHMMVSQ
jgi:hypothetical protein